MTHYHLCALQERLAKKNNNEKVTISIVDADKNIDILKVRGRSVERAGFNVHALQIHLLHCIPFRMTAKILPSLGV